MKKIFPLLLTTLFCHHVPADAQGKYAGAFKKFIGTTFTSEKGIVLLKSYPLHEGSVISAVGDPQQMILDIYRKGTTGVIVFGVKEDTTEKEFHMVDIIEIKNIPKAYEINATTCLEGATEGEVLIALVKTTQTEYAGLAKKAWRCNRDKLRFESINAKLIKCLNVGGD
jgi:hypothetical protein